MSGNGKWLAVLLAMLMAVMSLGLTAMAEGTEAAETAAEATEEADGVGEWKDGRSPSKPYEGRPEVDLTKQLGYMMFYPNEEMVTAHQCRKLYIYLPRTDVEAGEGELFVCNEKEGKIWSTAMNDESHVLKRVMSLDELDSLLWGDGMCFEVTLPKSLDLGKTYFVNIDKGAITAAEGSVTNSVIGGTEAWTFTVEGDYGVSGMEYRRPLEAEGEYEEMITEPQAGDEIRFDLTLGGNAVTAVVYGYYDTVDFVVSTFTESGEVTGQVTDEYPAWGIMFLDADGQPLESVDF